jgi:hypothetical protein
MDPYIEQRNIWGDFHQNLATEIQAQLNHTIQPRYVARLIPYVTYEMVEIAETQSVRPDVGVWQPQPPISTYGGGVATLVAPPAPTESIVAMEFPVTLRSVEIYEVATMSLVTAIEILSPVNKRRGHKTYQDYQRKRRELLNSEAHLLEIDLLRSGARPPLARPVPPAPYYITLSRAERRPRVEVWPLQLQEPLPILPIPLRAPDPDTILDLGAALAAVYERGAYALLIDYHLPPPPPAFSESEQHWLDTWLQQQGRR